MIEIIPNWHPLFVHFTVALFFVAAALFIIESVVPIGGSWRLTCLSVARWNLWIGAGFTGITLLAGWQAYNSVAHDTPSHLAMTDHKNWAFFTAGFFAVLTLWSLVLRKNRHGSGLFSLAIFLAAGMLGTTAWKGGEVVFRYGLGVMSMPQSSGKGHSHSHGPSDGSPQMKGAGHGHGSGQSSGTGAATNSTQMKSDGHGHSHGAGAGSPQPKAAGQGSATGAATNSPQPKSDGHGHSHGPAAVSPPPKAAGQGSGTGTGAPQTQGHDSKPHSH